MPPSSRFYRSLLFSTVCILIFSACSSTATPAPTPGSTIIPSITPTAPVTVTILPASTQTPYVITTTPEAPTSLPPEGTFFLSIAEGGYYHIFAFSPQELPLTRLTADPWDDIDPALSMDGRWLIYSSHRNGYWDLYRLDLTSGALLRLTDTLTYESAPSWSPDGAYVAYESNVSGNLDVFIRSASDPSQAPLQLTTNSPGADFSPAWSPRGRQIAFVSDRSGIQGIWLADLDNFGSFVEVSANDQVVASHPSWSPDGNHLAWAATDPSSGINSIYIWDAQAPASPARWAASGDWPVWQDDNTLATRLTTPNQTYLTGFSTAGEVRLPPVLLPGSILGMAYGPTMELLPGPFLAAAKVTPESIFNSNTSAGLSNPTGRLSLVDLEGVTAPYPQLQELAVNSFQALRTHVAAVAGWDALGNLENAYIPITVPLDPGLGNDWLYTGRAISLTPASIQAGLMAVVREDFGQSTYWRIYLRTSAQDGSQGMPLTQLPWDFSARSQSSTAYENGGQLMSFLPNGYWLDLTSLAAQYGWERIPALFNWRSYYTGARFNELAFTQDLDWYVAMQQLYPQEVLVTPTFAIPPTRTPTRTPLWYRSATPTLTPSPHFTSTP